MKLYIDTSNNRQITLKLGDKTITKNFLTPQAQNLLPEIAQALKKIRSNIQNITAISVHPGPGSFTGLRVGFSVANALGFALNIPVNGKQPGTVFPEYGEEPHITSPNLPN